MRHLRIRTLNNKIDGNEELICKDLETLSMRLMPNIRLETVWLAPETGPVKIEGVNGATELIEYDINKGSPGAQNDKF